MPASLINYPAVALYRLQSFDSAMQGKPLVVSDQGITGYQNELVLSLDKLASTRLLSLSASGSTETTPTQCTLSFILGLEDLQAGDPSTALNFMVMDTKAPAIGFLERFQYKLMDHVEIFYSNGNPHPLAETVTRDSSGNIVHTPDTFYAQGTVAPTVDKKSETMEFNRIFMGIVSNINFKWNPGKGLQIDMTCQGLFYWLDLIKVQPKTSLFEWMLRGKTLDSSEKQTQELAFSTRYDGMTMKGLIEKLLLSSDETNYIYLPEYDIRTVLSTLSVSSKATTFENSEIQSALNSSLNVYPAETGDTSGVQKQIQPKELDATFSDSKKTVASLSANGSNSAKNLYDVQDIPLGEVGHKMWQNQVNRDALSSYWDTQVMDLIRKYSISFLRYQDHDMVAYPVQFQMSQFLNGTYNSRLEMLRNVAGMSFYEIYQSPQGIVLVKPPLFNAPPTSYISPIEISSMSRSLNRDNILTSVTTQGLFTVGNSDEIKRVSDETSSGKTEGGGKITEVLLSTNFPFVQGTYTCLYPKGFMYALPDTTSGAEPFRITVPMAADSVIDLRDKLRKLYANSGNNNMTIYLSNGTSGKPISIDFGVSAGNKSANFIDVTNTSTTNTTVSGTNYLQTVILYRLLLSFGLSKANEIGGVSALHPAFWKTLKIHHNVLEKFSGTSIDIQSLQDIYTQIKTNNQNKSIADMYQIAYDYTYSLNSFINKGLFEDMLSSSRNKPIVKKYQNILSSDWQASLKNQLANDKFKSLGSLFSGSCNCQVKMVIPVIPTNRNDYTQTASGGEYNALEHGIRDMVINNNLVRTLDSAVSFSRFYLFKNNASAEVTTFVLNTIRPDIMPGFVVLNTMDLNAYYVQSVVYNITIGGSVTTTLTCIARRRPVWFNIPSLPQEQVDSIYKTLYANYDKSGESEFDRDIVTPILYGMTSGKLASTYKNSIYVGFKPDMLTSDPRRLKFLGWEYYGAPVVNDNFKNTGSSLDARQTTSSAFLPMYGAPTFYSGKPGKIPVGKKAILDGVPNIFITKGSGLFDPITSNSRGKNAVNTQAGIIPKDIASRYQDKSSSGADIYSVMTSTDSGSPLSVNIDKLSYVLAARKEDGVWWRGITANLAVNKFKFDAFPYLDEIDATDSFLFIKGGSDWPNWVYNKNYAETVPSNPADPLQSLAINDELRLGGRPKAWKETDSKPEVETFQDRVDLERLLRKLDFSPAYYNQKVYQKLQDVERFRQQTRGNSGVELDLFMYSNIANSTSQQKEEEVLRQVRVEELGNAKDMIIKSIVDKHMETLRQLQTRG